MDDWSSDNRSFDNWSTGKTGLFANWTLDNWSFVHTLVSETSFVKRPVVQKTSCQKIQLSKRLVQKTSCLKDQLSRVQLSKDQLSEDQLSFCRYRAIGLEKGKERKSGQLC